MNPGTIIRLEISLAPRTLVLGLAGLLLLSAAPELGSESVTLSTSLPAPSGVYQQLASNSKTVLARDSGGVGIGGDPGNAKLYVNGWVGIGTPTPTQALDVRGTMRSSGDLRTAAITAGGEVTAGSTIRVSGQVTATAATLQDGQQAINEIACTAPVTCTTSGNTVTINLP